MSRTMRGKLGGMGRQGQLHSYVDCPPDRVFEVITDVSGLPAWNRRMTAVVEAPDELAEGVEWVVGFRVAGQRFTSRSHVIELDRKERRFVYRSKREDENPSFTIWTWEVVAEGDGSRVSLAWELRPVTFLRKHAISRLRGWQIEHQDAPASLAALARIC